MAEWKHPDDLDRAGAAAARSDRDTPAGADEVAEALGKALISGRLRRIPRLPEHRAIVLAVLCSELRRRYPYSEVELNHALRQGLAHMNAMVDHVTCRRYLVDTGFLKRDRGGRRYLLNFPKLEATLALQARAAACDLVQQALAQRR